MKIQNTHKEYIDVTQEEITKVINGIYAEKKFLESMKKFNKEQEDKENKIARIIGFVGSILIVLYVILIMKY